MARSQGLLPGKLPSPAPAPPTTAFAFGAPQPLNRNGVMPPAAPPMPAAPVSRPSAPTVPVPPSQPAAKKKLQSLLYWRKSLFDPDRLFNHLAPLLSFIWTPTFVVLSLGMIVTAGVVFWANRLDIANQLSTAWNWQTAVTVWVTL